LPLFGRLHSGVDQRAVSAGGMLNRLLLRLRLPVAV
jgi:hypothetical protein